jgi:hypothetical protein
MHATLSAKTNSFCVASGLAASLRIGVIATPFGNNYNRSRNRTPLPNKSEIAQAD